MEVKLINTYPALLVLDLQELFSSTDGPFKNDAANLINNVNLFSSECHRMGFPVIYSRYTLSDDLSDAGLLADNPIVKEGYFCESSTWMKLDHRLQQPESCINLQRNRPGAFWGEGLERTIRQNNIDTLLICGLSVNNAISTTAREAFARDIPVIVVKDCCGTAPWETETDCYFEILNTWTAEVTSVKDLLSRLNKVDNSK